MNKLLIILLLFTNIAKANNLRDTVPTGVPQLFGSKFYEFKSYVLTDSFIMNAAGDTNLIPYYPSIKFKSSNNRWYGWNRSRWIDFLNSLDTISLSNRINGIHSTFANNGLSKSGDTVQLGQVAGDIGNPAILNSAREIPLNGFAVSFTGSGSISVGAVGGTNPKINSVATGGFKAINATAVNGTGVNVVTTGSGTGIFSQVTGTGAAAMWGDNIGNAGYGIKASSFNNGVIPFLANVFSSNNTSDTMVVAEFRRNASGGGTGNGIGMTLLFDGQTTTSTNVESGQIRNGFSTALHSSHSSYFSFWLKNNTVSARKALLASTGQWTWDGYPALTPQTDTTNIKPLGFNTTTGLIQPMANWVGSGGSVTLNNIGSGYRWVATPGGNFKTSIAGYGILKDSTTNANGITDKADTSVLATKYDLTNMGNLIAGKIAPSNSTGVNGNYYWNQIKSQLYLKAAGSWGNPFGYLISDTLQPLDTLLYNGSLVKMKEVWDTAAMTYNLGSIARNKNLAGNALLSYKDDPVFVTGWNITTGGAPIDPYKASYLHHVESNYDTKSVGLPYFEDHVSVLFKPGSAATAYATGERIHSINVGQTNYDIYEYATMANMSYQWRESPGAGYTPYFGMSTNGFGGIRLMTIDSITNGNTFQKYDGVDVWQKQTLNGRTRYLTLRSGFTDTAQLYAAGGTFVLQRVSGNGITAIQSGYLTLTNAATPSTNSFTFSTGGDGLMQILANSGGKFVTGFSGSVYGLALNKSITRNAYVDISNADLGQYYNMYFTNNNTYLDSVINGVNFNIEKYRSGSASNSALNGTYGYQLNLNDVNRMSTVFNSSTASNGNYLADWIWYSKASGGSTLNEIMRLGSNGNLTVGTGNNIVGTATNNSATAGNIGEEVNSTVSTYTNYTTSATYQNITSITLTAGDWDISAQETFSSNAATITAAGNAIFVISTTTASAAGATEGKNIAYIPQAALLGTSFESATIAPYRVSISGNTTYYLNSQATFTIGNPQFTGTIRARRIR